MRQIGTGQPIWWRASQSPAPSTTRKPIPTAAPASRRRPLISPRRRAQRRLQRSLSATALIAAGAAAFLAVAGSGAPAPTVQPALAEIERMLDLAGYGLTQVSLTGHRLTPDSDILDALDLASTPTLLSFDSRAARARIEALSWVERASIERVFPDSLEVHITERKPFAVWRLGQRSYLIDGTGRVLSAIPATTMPSLPRVAGEGAAAAAAELYALLSGYPAVLRRLELAERIGERRWRLKLAGSTSVDLPETHIGEALARVPQLVEAASREGANEVDLRVAGRTLVRRTEGSRQVATQVPIATVAAGGI